MARKRTAKSRKLKADVVGTVDEKGVFTANAPGVIQLRAYLQNLDGSEVESEPVTITVKAAE